MKYEIFIIINYQLLELNTDQIERNEKFIIKIFVIFLIAYSAVTTLQLSMSKVIGFRAICQLF